MKYYCRALEHSGRGTKPDFTPVGLVSKWLAKAKKKKIWNFSTLLRISMIIPNLL